jgi:O-6-methylguanine DNA methyltransferase
MGRVKGSNAGGKLYVHRLKTRFGEAVLLWSEEGLRSLEMGTGEAEGEARGCPGFEEAMGRYFAGEPERFDFDLDLWGLTEFERDVLRAAREIGYGEVRSYSWLAKKAGRPKAARAVGSVMAKNPLPVIIPCHRVIRADGKLGGFSMRGGVEMKRRLIELERRGKR